MYDVSILVTSVIFIFRFKPKKGQIHTSPVEDTQKSWSKHQTRHQQLSEEHYHRQWLYPS